MRASVITGVTLYGVNIADKLKMCRKHFFVLVGVDWSRQVSFDYPCVASLISFTSHNER